MQHFVLAAVAGPVVFLLFKLKRIPNLEYTPFIYAMMFSVFAFGIGTLGGFFQVYAVGLISYILSANVFFLLENKGSLTAREQLLMSLRYLFEAALFSLLLGMVAFWVGTFTVSV